MGAEAERSGFGKEEAADNQRVYAGAEITAHRMARGEHQRFPEEIERSVEQYRGGSAFAKAAQKSCEERIYTGSNYMKANSIARQEIIRKFFTMLRPNATHIGHITSWRSENEILPSIVLRH